MVNYVLWWGSRRWCACPTWPTIGEAGADVPVVDEAIGRVVDAARRNGVASGIHLGDPAAVLR
jgi:hypothetical protein